MNTKKIVAQWDESGIECTVVNLSDPTIGPGEITLMFRNHWFCGYVKVPPSHPLNGKCYSYLPDEVNGVNGGASYSYTDETGTVFGFDTVHSINETLLYTESMTIDEVTAWAKALASYKPGDE